MTLAGRTKLTLIAALVAVATWGPVARAQQTKYPKQADLPNPYRLVEGWPTLPTSMNGGHWGELIRADIDPKGNIWVFHRCFNTEPAGAATCVGRTDPPILEFDPSGKLLTSFGGGMFAFPHGFTVDRQGNIWASDANASETVLGMSAKDANGVVRGHQVFKLSPTGKVLMTLGKEGVKGDGPDTFDQPSGIAIAPNGDIFVTDGHGKNDRVVKFSKDGKFIKTWGHHGSGPGEFDQPHDISIGGSQRLRVRCRPQQQPRPGLRPGRKIHRRVETIWPPERRVYRERRHALRERLAIEFDGQSRLFEGHHRRERQGRLARGLHSRP